MVVSDALLHDLGLVERINRRREDDKAAYIRLGICIDNEQVDIAVQGSVWEGVDAQQWRVGVGRRVQVGVDVLSWVATGRFLYFGAPYVSPSLPVASEPRAYVCKHTGSRSVNQDGPVTGSSLALCLAAENGLGAPKLITKPP